MSGKVSVPQIDIDDVVNCVKQSVRLPVSCHLLPTLAKANEQVVRYIIRIIPH